MLIPPTSSLRVVRYAEGAGFAPYEWARALECVDWERDGRLLKEDLGSAVWSAELSMPKRTMRCVVKVQLLHSIRRRLQSLLRTTQAHRQWAGAELLARHRITAASPRAILFGSARVGRAELLVLEHVDGPTLLERVVQPGSWREQHELARRVARHVAAMDAEGLSNRDSKPSNLIVQDQRLVVLDTVAIRAAGGQSERMLRDLLIEPMRRGHAPSRAVCMRVVDELARARRDRDGNPLGPKARRSERRRLWTSVRDAVEEHLSRSPLA